MEEKELLKPIVVPKPSRWRMLATMAACFYLNVIAFGMSALLGVLYVEFIDYFHCSRSEAALVQSVNLRLTLCGSLLFPTLLTKYDAGLVVALASLIAAISFCTSAFSPNMRILIILTGGVTGLSVSANALAGFVVVSWMFQSNRKSALALITIGSAFGQLTMPYLATALVNQYDWNGTVIIAGALAYLNCLPCGLLIHFSKDFFQKGDAQKINISRLVDLSCLTDLALILFLITCCSINATGSVEQSFVVDMTVLKGFSEQAGAILLSLYGLLSIIGKCIGTTILKLAKNTKLEIHMSYSMFTWGISHIIISQSPVYWGMVLGMIIRGMSNGFVWVFSPGLQVDMRGIEKYPQTAAITNFVSGIGLIVGGYLGGMSFDVTGSYFLIFSIATGVQTLNAVTLIAIFFILKYRRKRKKAYENI